MFNPFDGPSPDDPENPDVTPEESYFLTALNQIIKAARDNTLTMITVEVEGKVGMALASFEITPHTNTEADLIITPLAIVPENELWDRAMPITKSEDSSFSFEDLPKEVRDMIRKKTEKKRKFTPPMKGSFDEFGMES